MKTLNVIIIMVCTFMFFANNGYGKNDPDYMSKRSYPLDTGNSTYFQGYDNSLAGSTIEYHSPSPDIQSALLVRATDGTMTIEWETEPAPSEVPADTVKFIWLAGLGCNIGMEPFDLYLNDTFLLTFQTYDEKVWKVSGAEGSELSFKTSMIDMAKDRFGAAVLSVPKKLVKDGKAQTLKITGHRSGSNAWVMTFQGKLQDAIALMPRNALQKQGDTLLQPVDMSITYLGEPVSAEISIQGVQDTTVKLNSIFNHFTVAVPEVETERKVEVSVTIGSRQVFSRPLTVSPVRKFTIHLVQHTHTDIGYTRPQTEILSEHLRYIDYALDYCDQTDDYPEDAKFRWTCEASWPVREYLENRPYSQIERLRKRVQEGRIELTGMMFNMSELADEASYVDFVQAIGEFKKHGMPVKTAMQNDVNGFAWCLVDYFQDTGVEYLSMGTHGHKALIAFDHPTPFWMESPSGNRLLAFRADHYMTGNFFGIHVADMQNLETGLFDYLEELFAKGYPYDQIAVQYSGYSTDNSPPGLNSCEMVKRWNEKYAWPKLRTAVASDFLDQMKKAHGENLPVYRAAWPDWWTDGFGSAARETAASRNTHAEMIANLGLLSMVRMSGVELPASLHEKIAVVQDALLFYDEHTFGAAESISDPMAENSKVQWMEKAAYVWDAVKNSRLLTEYGMGLIQPLLPRSKEPVITVFNTLNWQRSGLMQVYIDNEILPKSRSFRIVDADGMTVEAQLESSRNDGNTWSLWLENIPPLGFKTYRIEVDEGPRKRLPIQSADHAAIENKYYRIEIDSENGALQSLFDKELNLELVDNRADWHLGQLIYEISNPRGQLDQFRLDDYQRTPWENIELHDGIDGPIWRSIVITGTSEGFDKEKGVELEIRLFKKAKRIDFHYSGRKERVRDPESVYIAFPFHMPESEIMYEVQGGLVRPGKDQIPGSSSDWNTFQNFVRIKNSHAQIVWGSEAMPLVQLGDINLGKFMYIAEVNDPHIYSWPMNNLWVTNFRASQEGDLEWTYYFTSGDEPTATAATRFGWGARVPFLSRVLPAAGVDESLTSHSFLNLDQTNLLLVSTRPAKDHAGIILQLRELEGKATTVNVNQLLNGAALKSAYEVNVLEERIAQDTPDLKIKPYATKFIKVEL